ncbi:hypothetical protein BSKO_11389 [Bryopsis sp. KO-2023]|nr:hypothetical protein BSKO_11389 [Bryopsis sp. KO-2023]
MPALSLALVGPEEDIQAPEKVLRSLGKKTPLKLVTAKEAVAAVSSIGGLQEQTGKVHAIFAHNRFTAAGKEPYIEVLHKALKKKFQGIPIYAFGKESKAGTKGKSYTEFVDFDDAKGIGALLTKLGGGAAGGGGGSGKSARSSSGSPRRPKSSTPKSPSAKPQGGAFPMSPPAMGGPPSPFAMSNSGRFGYMSGPMSPTMGGPVSPNSFGPPSPIAPQHSGFAPISLGTFQANQPFLHQGVQTSFGMGDQHIGTQTSLIPQRSGMTPGGMTPHGALTPNGYSTGQQLMTNGSPNNELIKHLSMELDRLKSLVLEKRAQSSHSAEMLGQSQNSAM